MSIGDNEDFGTRLNLVERVVDPVLELARRGIPQVDFGNHLSDRVRSRRKMVPQPNLFGASVKRDGIEI